MNVCPPLNVLGGAAGQMTSVRMADLDPFQPSFRPSYGTETPLVTLVDDLYQELYKGNVSLLTVKAVQQRTGVTQNMMDSSSLELLNRYWIDISQICFGYVFPASAGCWT